MGSKDKTLNNFIIDTLEYQVFIAYFFEFLLIIILYITNNNVNKNKIGLVQS